MVEEPKTYGLLEGNYWKITCYNCKTVWDIKVGFGECCPKCGVGEYVEPLSLD